MNKIPVKIKVLLGAMISAAVLITLSFFVNINNLSDLKAGILNTFDSSVQNQGPENGKKNSNYFSESDIDKDGLFDYEEPLYGTDPLNPDTDGDGFLDGEEIASSRNPTIPGPNDELRKNLTQRVSELTLAGLAEGSLKPDSPDYVKSLNLVVDEILYQSQINLPTSQISINIVPDSEEVSKKYVEEIIPLIDSIVEEEGQSILDLVDLVDATIFFDESKLNPENKSFINLRNFATRRVFDLTEDLSILETSPVPQSLAELHKLIVKKLKNLALNYNALTKADTDPIQAMMSFRNIMNIFINEIPDMLENYYNSVK